VRGEKCAVMRAQACTRSRARTRTRAHVPCSRTQTRPTASPSIVFEFIRAESRYFVTITQRSVVV
jgi:hypothetical protein